MNTRFLLAIFSVAALVSCSTSYKAQTPDDVYFSPAKPGAETVKKETTPQQEAKQQDQYKYDDYYSSEDRYLRWKVRDPQRWSTFDDYDYQWYSYNNSLNYNYYNYNQPWGTYWNSYWTWNSSYNPYCNKVIVVNPKTNATVYNKIRTYTPGTYNNKNYNNANNNRPVKVAGYNPKGTFTNGSNNSFGNTLRKVFSNSGSNYSNNNSSSSSSSSPSRTYSPSSSGSSSSGSSGGSRSSGGGGGGVSRPGRGG